MLNSIAAALLAGSTLLGGVPGSRSPDPKWRAILEPLGGGKVRGGAMVEAKGPASTRFTITIRDATPNSTLAWHMHSGSCKAPGPVVGSGYSELRTGPGGTAESAITLGVAPPTSGNFLVQVHDASGTPISCGDLKSIGGGTL